MDTASYRSKTSLTPTALMAGPDSPPNLLLRYGLANSGEMTIALSVLIATTASPPPSCTARAISSRMCVLGVSFAHTGTDTDPFTSDTMPFTSFGSVPTSMP